MAIINTCPNQKSKEWKQLVSQVGDELAWTTWMYYKGDYPILKTTSQLRAEIGVPTQSSYSNKANILSKVRQYNQQNGTSHAVNVQQVGESQTAKYILMPNYLPVNAEQQRQRDYQRSTKDKIFGNAFNQTYTQGTLNFEESNETDVNVPSNDIEFGLDISSPHKLEYSINTLHSITSFLDELGVEQRVVDQILLGDGTVVENALAAANFVEQSIDIINDLEKRPRAWNKLPEEAAHWWYRLLKTDNELKQALWESAKTIQKAGELAQDKYGNIIQNPDDLREEAIGQLIAHAIERIDKKIPTDADLNLFQKFIRFLKKIVKKFSDVRKDPFEVAALNILSSDLTDLMSLQEYTELVKRVTRTEVPIDNADLEKNISYELEDTDWYKNLFKRFKVKSSFKDSTIAKAKAEILRNIRGRIENGGYRDPLQKIKMTPTLKRSLEEYNNYENVTPDLLSFGELRKKYQKQGISLKSPIQFQAKKFDLEIYNTVRELIAKDNPTLKTVSFDDFMKETLDYLETNYLLGFAEESNWLGYRVGDTFKYPNIQGTHIRHRKISLRFNDEYMNQSSHFSYSPSAWGNITYFSTNGETINAALIHEIQNDFFEKLEAEQQYPPVIPQNLEALYDVEAEDISAKKAMKRMTLPYFIMASQGNYELFLEKARERRDLHDTMLKESIPSLQKRVDLAYLERKVFQDLMRRFKPEIMTFINEGLQEFKDFVDPDRYNSGQIAHEVSGKIREELMKLLEQHYETGGNNWMMIPALTSRAFIRQGKIATANQLYYSLLKKGNKERAKAILYNKQELLKARRRVWALKSSENYLQLSKEDFGTIYRNFSTNANILLNQVLEAKPELDYEEITGKKKPGKVNYEEIASLEKRYFEPIVHHLIQTIIKEKGKDFPIYFSGREITILTQGSDKTARLYAGPNEILQQDTRKEPGALWSKMNKIHGIKLRYEDDIPGFDREHTGGYRVDTSNYNLTSPILFGLDTTKKDNTTKIKEELKNDAAALEEILKSLDSRMKALKASGKAAKSTLIKNELLLGNLSKQYREGHFLLGIETYLNNVTGFFEDLYGTNEFTDEKGVVHPAKDGSLDKLEKNVKDATFEDIIKISHTVRQMGNFATSYTNVMASVLHYLNEEEITDAKMKKRVGKILETARAIKSQAERVKDDYNTLAIKSIAKFLNEFGWQGGIKALEDTLKEPVEDIAGSQRWLDSLSNVNDDVLRLLAKATIDYKEEARKEIYALEKTLISAKKAMEANSISTTEWIAERNEDGEPTGDIISEIDWYRFGKEQRALYEGIERDYGVPYNERSKLSATKVSEIRKRVSAWYKENTMNKEDVSKLVEKNKKGMSPKEFERWAALNTKYDTKRDRFIIPTMKNANFESIKNNPTQMDYYNKMIDLKLQLEKSFPESFKHPRRLPQVRKDMIERLKVGDIKGIKDNVIEHFKVMEDEAERGFDYGIMDERGNLVNFVPIFYTNRLSNMKDMSLDITSSMMEFARMAIERKHMNRVVDLLEMGKDILLERGVYKKNNKNKILRAAKYIAGQRVDEPVPDITGGNLIKMYEKFLDMIVYGKIHKQELSLWGIDIAKVLDTFGKFTAMKQLGLNVFAGIANVLTGKAQERIEAMGSEFFAYSDLLYGDKIYIANMPGVLFDVGQRMATNKLTLWNEHHDTLEDFNERLAKLNIEDKTLLSRAFHSSPLFLLSHAGEHYLHTRISLALANEFRYCPDCGHFVHKKEFFRPVTDLQDEQRNELRKLTYTKEQFAELKKSNPDWAAFKAKHKAEVQTRTREIKEKYQPKIKALEEDLKKKWEGLTNYWDAHEVRNNRLILKSSFQGNQPEKDRNAFTALVRGINHHLNGIYNTNDRNALQQIAVGRLAMMFRKWMKPAWNRRFQKLHYDYRLGSDMEGYYRTSARFMMGLISDLRGAQFSIYKNWNILTDTEKANLRRTFTEVAYFMAVLALATILTNMGSGDDDDDWALNMLAYQANRQVTEIGAFTPSPFMLSEGLKLIKTPMAAVGMAQELIVFAQFWNWNEELTRGKYKGMTKLHKSLIRTIPPMQAINDLAYPREKIQYYLMFR